MFHKLWVFLGLKLPSVSDAMRSRQSCIRVGYRAYCVKNRAGFAEAFTHHLETYRSVSSSLALYEHLHKDIVTQAQEMDYPCVVYFSKDSMTSMPFQCR